MTPYWPRNQLDVINTWTCGTEEETWGHTSHRTLSLTIVDIPDAASQLSHRVIMSIMGIVW